MIQRARIFPPECRPGPGRRPGRLAPGWSASGSPRRLRHLGAIGGGFEISSAEEARGVAEEAGAHRIALAGDRVGAGAGPADVAGDQCDIDDGLGGAHRLVPLVDAHRPPETSRRFRARWCRPARTISPTVRPVSPETRSGVNARMNSREFRRKPFVCAAMNSALSIGRLR